MDLFYKRYGEGPPLVILHGLLGASGNWHTLSSRAFGSHFEVFTLDQRNHGRSPHSEVFDYPTMADDLRGFMDRQGLARAHVLGHSMGGKTAMHFALTHPERVDKLIIVDMAPKPYPPLHGPLLDALRAVDFEAHRTRAAIEGALTPQIPDVPVRKFVLQNLVRAEHGGYRWRMNLDAIHRQYHRINVGLEADGTFEGPTLFLRGGASDYVADEDTEVIISFFPEAEFATIPEAGHWVHAEAPEAFTRHILDFLQRF